MFTSHDRLPRPASIAASTTLALALSFVSYATPSETIRVWKIGSPHTGETPATTIPAGLTAEALARGFDLTIETFPAKGFAATFAQAVTGNAAPDVLVFDNMGVMNGITTRLGHFRGIGEDPFVRKDLIRVTGAFDELLGPARGWTYLYKFSANHDAAKRLALMTPRCSTASSGPISQGELAEIVRQVATAYLEGDTTSLQQYSDPERLPALRNRETARVEVVQHCGIWGNDKLAIASINASYVAETALGHTLALLVLRKPSSQWQLLAAARDPISNGAFVRQLPALAAALGTEAATPAVPMAATLLAPASSESPRASTGQRFGDFTWLSSQSDDVVAEIAEFSYHDDARLFLTQPRRPGSRRVISAGELWTTQSEWNWRIWSVSRTGDITFSETRSFPH
jgi:hypothetical protein